jgi:N-acetylmuramic acid 6-phosphate (MurNAc-6-P) etherase
METLMVDRARAMDLLKDSDGRVKVAIVMGRMGVGSEEAEALLEGENGFVARVVGDPL